jgi:hypothetical protein
MDVSIFGGVAQCGTVIGDVRMANITILDRYRDIFVLSS